ncbi:MAG: glycerate kinase [Actinobacteria bacterium]|nr:glycerate kinase [Actinomycetota bacterium]
MKVVIAPDSFGGTLGPRAAASAIADGWRRARPDDELTTVPLSDGGEGLLDALAGPDDTWLTTEACGPMGHPLDTGLLLRGDGTAVIETALVCGLALVAPERRDPLQATTYGVGELLDAARDAGCTRLLVGLGGSATVDGGAGALTGLGFRLRVADGSGLKVGGRDLHRVRAAGHGWARDDWDEVEVVLLADVSTVLADAARRFGPQKGATPEAVALLERGLAAWADVAERDLAGGSALRGLPGSGAAGGLGFGLAAGIGGRLVPGAAAVADLADLDGALAGADLVVTGEGRLDATTAEGKVVTEVLARASGAAVAVCAVVGQVAPDAAVDDLSDLEAAAPQGPGDDVEAEVAAAAARLAGRLA